MKVIIKETSAIEQLSIIDPKTGVNYIDDFIGNQGALSDGQFVRNDHGDYHCSQETFDWWSRIVADYQKLEDRIHALISIYGTEKVYAAIEEIGDHDLADNASQISAALDETFLKGN